MYVNRHTPSVPHRYPKEPHHRRVKGILTDISRKQCTGMQVLSRKTLTSNPKKPRHNPKEIRYWYPIKPFTNAHKDSRKPSQAPLGPTTDKAIKPPASVPIQCTANITAYYTNCTPCDFEKIGPVILNYLKHTWVHNGYLNITENPNRYTHYILGQRHTRKTAYFDQAAH